MNKSSKPSKPSKKLALNVEVVRRLSALSAHQLAAVVGGSDTGRSPSEHQTECTFTDP